MNKKINQTMMQYFEWYLPADCWFMEKKLQMKQVI